MGRGITRHLEPGQQFRFLTVLEPDAGRVGRTAARPKGQRAARVRCRCGTVKLVMINNLVNGTTVSCGCYRASVIPRGGRAAPADNRERKTNTR